MKKIFIMILLLALSSCASTSSNKSYDQLVKENKGVVIGEKPSLAKRMLVVGDRFYIHFKAIDGNQIEYSSLIGLPDEVELSIGKHALIVICSGNIGTVQLQKDIPVTLTVIAGHKYLVKPILTSDSCIAKTVDITNEKS